MKLLFILVPSIFIIIVNAEEPQTNDVVKLLKLKGFDLIVEERERENSASIDRAAKEILGNYKAKLSPDRFHRLELLLAKFKKANLECIDKKEFFMKFVEIYKSKISKEEADTLIRFYESPLGKKSLAIDLLSVTEFKKYYKAIIMKTLDQEKAILSQGIQEILSEE